MLQPAQAEDRVANDLSTFLGQSLGRQIHDPNGTVMAPGALDGKVVAITFFDTGCSILCATRLLDLASVARGLPATERGRVAIVAVTADPARDTSEALKAFAASLKLDLSSVALASGEPSATAAVLASVGWQANGATPDREPPTVFVFDRMGRFAMRYTGAPIDKRRLAQDLTTLADLDHGAGQGVSQVSVLN